MENEELSVIGTLYQVRRFIEKEMPKCREASLAITKLDEAAMWYKQIPVELKDLHDITMSADEIDDDKLRQALRAAIGDPRERTSEVSNDGSDLPSYDELRRKDLRELFGLD